MTKYLVEVIVHPDQGPPFTASDVHGVIDNALGGFGTVRVVQVPDSTIMVSLEEAQAAVERERRLK